MKKKYRALVIGCGRMGARPSSEVSYEAPKGWLPLSHCEAIQQSKDIELVAVCDTHSDNLQKAQSLYKIENGYTEWNQALKEIQPDIVTVATRTPEKKNIVKTAIESGVRGLYVEKPLSFSIQETWKLLSLAREQKACFFYGVNRRYHPTYRKAKQLVEEGLIGSLESIHIEHGPAPLFWSHPHSTDLIQFFSGGRSVKEVSCNMEIPETAVIKDLFLDADPIIKNAWFKMENGLIATIGVQKGLNTRITGSKGTLTVVSDGSYIEHYNGVETGYFTSRNQEFSIDDHPATVTAMNELSAALDRGVSTDTLHISKGTEMLIAAAWSHMQNGQRIQPNEIPDEFRISGRTGANFA